MAVGVEDYVCSDIPWKEWTSTTELLKVSGNYILMNNVNSGQNQISVEAKINLNLNGKTVKENGRAYVPWGNSSTTIEPSVTDSQWDPEDPEHCGRMIGTSKDQGGVVWTCSKANIRLFAGILDASAITSTFSSGNNGLIDATGLASGAKIGITVLGEATRAFATVSGSSVPYLRCGSLHRCLQRQLPVVSDEINRDGENN